MLEGLSANAPLLEEGNTCGECGGTLIENREQHTIVCGQCGLEVGSSSSKFRSEYYLEGRFHHGPPTDDAYEDTTEIFHSDLTKLAGPRRAQFHRLRAQQRRATSSNQERIRRNMVNGTVEMSRIAGIMGISDTLVKTGSRVLHLALQAGLKYMDLYPYVYAALYTATKIHKSPRPLAEFVDAVLPAPTRQLSEAEIKRLNEERKQMKRSIFSSFQHLHRLTHSKTGPLPVRTPEQYIDRYLKDNEDRFNEGVYTKAMEICGQLRALSFIRGRRPQSIAASVIYVTCILEGIEASQSLIEDITRVSEVTVRGIYQEIVNVLDLPIKNGRMAQSLEVMATS